MRVFRVLLLAALLVSALTPIGVARAAPTSNDDTVMPRYFSETGFWLQGEFRRYWETHGGLFVHGYPITAVFEQDGMLVQYFERSVFEYHPEHAGTPYVVLLRRLGADRTAHRTGEPPFQPLSPFEDSKDHRYFPETQHALSYGFKTFWENNGGLPNFGYPLSEEFDERNQPPPAGDGEVHTVQYFERARFEYHPEYRGTRYEVLLGLLGREALAQDGAPDEALTRQDPELPPPDLLSGRIHGPHAGTGFNVYLRGDGRPEATTFNQKSLDTFQDIGFGWIRIQLQWATLEPQPGAYDLAPADRIINPMAQRGIKVLASVVGSPAWANANGGIPQDTSRFKTLMQVLADRYETQVQAWEIWNEQNLASNVGGRVEVAPYVNLLKAGYEGVKAADPNAIVLFGGLTPTGVNDPSLAIDDVQYLREIYAYQNGVVKQYFDALGAHPGSNNNPPDTMWPENPGPGPGWQNDPSFYFRRIEQLRQVMVDAGDAAKQIWLTEFGWTTENQAPGYEYGAQNSPEEQAQYLTRAFEIGRTEWPWIGVMFVWNLNYSVVSGPQDEKTPWAVVNADWSPRPSYDALKEMPK